jgi:predicted nucleic acid-binding protein
MPTLVLDTSVLISAHNDREENHLKAKAILASIADRRWDSVLLHEYVFLEVVTVLAARRSFAKAVEVGEALLASTEIELVSSSEDFTSVWQTFRNQAKGKLSFADSALVSLARGRSATHVATFDRDLLKASGLADAASVAG